MTDDNIPTEASSKPLLYTLIATAITAIGGEVGRRVGAEAPIFILLLALSYCLAVYLGFWALFKKKPIAKSLIYRPPEEKPYIPYFFPLWIRIPSIILMLALTGFAYRTCLVTGYLEAWSQGLWKPAQVALKYYPTSVSLTEISAVKKCPIPLSRIWRISRLKSGPLEFVPIREIRVSFPFCDLLRSLAAKKFPSGFPAFLIKKSGFSLLSSALICEIRGKNLRYLGSPPVKNPRESV